MSRIEKDFKFIAGVFFEEMYLMNLYNGTLYMDIVTENDSEQLIAIERIQYFIQNYIEHCVFVHDENKTQIGLFEKAGLTVLALPESPFDQIVGIILLRKLNAIAEGRVIVSEIRLGSKLGSDIRFHNTLDETEDFDEVAWYNDPALTITNVNKKVKKDKIVKFDELEDWTKVGLVWKS